MNVFIDNKSIPLGYAATLGVYPCNTSIYLNLSTNLEYVNRVTHYYFCHVLNSTGKVIIMESREEEEGCTHL